MPDQVRWVAFHLVASFSLAHNEDRTGRCGQYLLGDATKEETGKAGEAAGAHDDHIRVQQLRRRENGARRPPLRHRQGHALGSNVPRSHKAAATLSTRRAASAELSRLCPILTGVISRA